MALAPGAFEYAPATGIAPVAALPPRDTFEIDESTDDSQQLLRFLGIAEQLLWITCYLPSVIGEYCNKIYNDPHDINGAQIAVRSINMLSPQ